MPSSNFGFQRLSQTALSRSRFLRLAAGALLPRRLTPVTDYGADRAAAARHKHNVPRMHGETARQGGVRRPAVTEIRGTILRN